MIIKWTNSLWNPSEATGVMVSTFWFFVQRGFGNCPIQIATISVIICNYHCDTLWQLNIDVKIKTMILEKKQVYTSYDFLSMNYFLRISILPSRKLAYPPDKAYLKMMFLFPRWDMLISWGVYFGCCFVFTTMDSDSDVRFLENRGTTAWMEPSWGQAVGVMIGGRDPKRVLPPPTTF